MKKMLIGTTSAMLLAMFPMLSIIVADAATSGTVTSTVSIQSGGLSISLPGAGPSFGSITDKGVAQTVGGYAYGNWIVTDATGTGDGWHATIQATQFTETTPSGGFATGTSALVLPTGSLALTGSRTVTAGTGSEAVSASPNGPYLENQTVPLDTGYPDTVLEANTGYGMGTYTVNEPNPDYNFTLDPSTKAVDLTNYPGAATPYSSTLTYSIISGP